MILCTAGTRAVLAQESPPPPPATDQQPLLLEELVIVAEKQATGRPLQNVPIAVTGVDTASALEQNHVTNIQDLGHMAPNAYLDTSGTLLGTAAFTIRGVGERSSTASIDPAVSVTQDGMPLSLQTGLALLGTFDTETVEILRGPQGVLQGVGAAGGAVTFTTPLPSRTFSADTSVTAGNFDTFGATGTVQGPLSDHVFGKLAVYEQRTAGFYENTTDEGTYTKAPGNPTGLEPQHPTGLVSGLQTVVVKPTFLFEVSEDVKFKVFAQFESDMDGASAPEAVNLPTDGGPAYKFGTVFGYTPTFQPYQTNMATPGFTHITEEHLIGQLDWRLGQGVWTTIAAVRNVELLSVYDNYGSPFNVFLVDTKEQNRQASLESRYSAAVSDRINILGGAYLFADNLPVTVVDGTNTVELSTKNVLPVPTDINSLANLQNQLIQYNQKTQSAALFGNVDYKILQNLTLSGGVRYQYEHKDMDIQPGANAAGVVYCTVGTLNNCPTTWYDSQKTWNTPTWRGVLSWQATDDLLAYFSYSRGWGAGNYNGSPSTLGAAITPANPETVDSYELGVKSEWFAHRFRANMAVFDENFDNIQRTAITSVNGLHVSTLLNAATARIRGAELELAALPFAGLKLFATGGYVNAVYQKFTAQLPTDNYNLTENPLELGFANLPTWTTDGGAAYTFSLPRVDGSFSLNADYSWRSKQWGDFGNSPQGVIKAYGLLNASINHVSGPWTLSLWGRNLHNTAYYEAAAISAGWQYFPGIPRTYGMSVFLKLY